MKDMYILIALLWGCLAVPVMSTVNDAVCGFIAATDIESLPDTTMWTCSTSGVPNTNPCAVPVWTGVECNGGAIVSLAIPAIGLTGTLPTAIGGFTDFTRMDISFNNLGGSIPSTLTAISGLVNLNIEYNALTGLLPSAISANPKLDLMYLNNNRLEGQIPSAIGTMSTLQQLRLYNNKFTGTIPTSFDQMVTLDTFQINHNKLSGALPTAIGGMTALTLLQMNNNKISGTLPTTLGDLSNVQEFRMQVNKLTGRIPSVIGGMNELTVLLLYGNSLTGPIPKELGSLDKLVNLWVSYNSLVGTIPTEFDGLTSLQEIQLNNNKLSGTIPTVFGTLGNLHTLLLSDNSLSGSIPTSYGDNTLKRFEIKNNLLTGNIPTALCSLTGLTVLEVSTISTSGLGCYAECLTSVTIFTAPTWQCTAAPTGQPTGQPTQAPAGVPTGKPTVRPTAPTTMPSGQPTSVPTSPTGQPTGSPSGQPTGRPSGYPTSRPTGQPTAHPTGQPTGRPTSSPTKIGSAVAHKKVMSTGEVAGISIGSVIALMCCCCCCWYWCLPPFLYWVYEWCGWEQEEDEEEEEDKKDIEMAPEQDVIKRPPLDPNPYVHSKTPKGPNPYAGGTVFNFLVAITPGGSSKRKHQWPAPKRNTPYGYELEDGDIFAVTPAHLRRRSTIDDPDYEYDAELDAVDEDEEEEGVLGAEVGISSEETDDEDISNELDDGALELSMDTPTGMPASLEGRKPGKFLDDKAEDDVGRTPVPVPKTGNKPIMSILGMFSPTAATPSAVRDFNDITPAQMNAQSNKFFAATPTGQQKRQSVGDNDEEDDESVYRMPAVDQKPPRPRTGPSPGTTSEMRKFFENVFSPGGRPNANDESWDEPTPKGAAVRVIDGKRHPQGRQRAGSLTNGVRQFLRMGNGSGAPRPFTASYQGPPKKEVRQFLQVPDALTTTQNVEEVRTESAAAPLAAGYKESLSPTNADDWNTFDDPEDNEPLAESQLELEVSGD